MVKKQKDKAIVLSPSEVVLIREWFDRETGKWKYAEETDALREKGGEKSKTEAGAD